MARSRRTRELQKSSMARLEGPRQSTEVCILPPISQVGSLRPRKRLARMTQLVRGGLGSPGSHAGTV